MLLNALIKYYFVSDLTETLSHLVNPLNANYFALLDEIANTCVTLVHVIAKCQHYFFYSKQFYSVQQFHN